jgi:hypothetical protein
MMSTLNIKQRPTVVFDPSIRQHREWYHMFLTRRTWGACPVRFMVDDQTGDLISFINKKLLTYYVSVEFDKKTELI